MKNKAIGICICLVSLFIHITPACYAQDAGVIAIISPVSATNLSATETITVEIQNFGLTTLTNLSLQYDVNGVLSPIEVFPGPLLPASTATFSFVATANLSAWSYYYIQAFTLLPGDLNPQNDRKLETIINQNWQTDTLWPAMTANWTGTIEGPGSTTPYVISQNSLIHCASGGVRAGWMKFELDSLYAGYTLVDAELHWYNNSVSGSPRLRISRLTHDPVTATPVALWNEISTGFQYNPATNCSHATAGWNVDKLGNTQILTDLKMNSFLSPSPWWACGFYEEETSAGQGSLSVDGWSQAQRPYLLLRYIPFVLPIDIGVVDLIIPPFALAGQAVVPQVLVGNYGTIAMSFNVVVTAPGGYTATQLVTQQPGAMGMLAFPPLILPAGTCCITACAVVQGDQNLINQCITKCITIDQKLTQAYGFLRKDPCGFLRQGPVKFYLEHPEALTQIAVDDSPDYLVSGSWGKDPMGNETWYATEIYDPPLYNQGNLVKINPVSGAITNVGQLGLNIDGISYDYAQGILWGISSLPAGASGTYTLKLYEIDRNTGFAYFAANLGFTQGKVQGFACHASGMAFFTDTGNEQFYALYTDPYENFNLEMVGAGSLNLMLGQDLEFSRADGKLYLSGHDSVSGQGGLYNLDAATGGTSLIGNFPEGCEISGFAIPYTAMPAIPDLALLWIRTPSTGPLDTTAPVIVRIGNVSPASLIADYNISIQLDNGTITTINWAQNGYPAIPGGFYQDFSFSAALFDFSVPGASYCLRAWVWNVTGDANQDNDSTEKCITNTLCTLPNLCFPNSTQEPESCGLDLNGGCNSSPPAFDTLISGDARCGVVWKANALADEDWYTFSLLTAQSVRVYTRTEFAMNMELYALPCGSGPALAQKSLVKCTEDSLFVLTLAAGTYALKIAPDLAGPDLSCAPGNGYSLKFVTDYCQPSSLVYTGSDAYIMHVKLDSINNSSGFTAGGYADYTQLSTSLAKGKPFTVSALVHNYDLGDAVSVYFDWNHNQSFSDPGETYPLSGNQQGVNQLFQDIIMVPAGVGSGVLRMRIRVVHDTTVAPCGDYAVSETEDYTLHIQPKPPTIITTLGNISGPCIGTYNIPILVDSCYNVQGIHFNMTVSAGLSLMGVNSLHAALNPASLTVTQSGSQIVIDWFSMTPVSPGSGLLMNLAFLVPQGTSSVVWTAGADSSYYANATSGYLDASWQDANLFFGNCADLSGNVYYGQMSAGVFSPKLMGNMAGNCDSLWVMLRQGSFVVDTACPGFYGNYHFTNLANGNYSLRAQIMKQYAGVNAVDAQMIQMNVTHINNFYLDPFYLKGGDVNGSGGTPNSVDALLIMYRWVNLIPNYQYPTCSPGSPDWYSESHPVMINGSANQSQDIIAMCTGDVNGSYQNTYPPKSQVISSNERSLVATAGVFDLPVYAENAVEVGSISLAMDYPTAMEVLEVSISKAPENLVYQALNGHLRVAWYSLDPLLLEAGDVLLTLKVKVPVNHDPILCFTNKETMLTDGFAQTIEGLRLEIPKIISATSGNEISLINVPNPFNTYTDILYSIPQAGHIRLILYDILGRESAILYEGNVAAGSHSFRFDNPMPGMGVYVVKLSTEVGQRTRRLLIVN